MEVGKEFSSWESFMHSLEQYSKENKVVYVVGTCKPVETANKNDSLHSKFPIKFKYCFARMLCKHYGGYSSKSTGLAQHQRTCKTGCTSSILVSVNKKRTALVIKEANLQHVHGVSENICNKHPQNHKLQAEERCMASVLLRSGVPLSRVQEFISNTYSKAPKIRDLQNIKSGTNYCFSEKESHEFAFLSDLDQLMAEDPESIIEMINFTLSPGAIYIQTSEMTERMKSLPEGHLQIVTHYINEKKISVVSVIGIDSELNPHILAFCIVIIDAETAVQCFFEAFVRNNSEFCDSLRGIVLDCSKENADFLQHLIPQASVAWSRSYILEEMKNSTKNIHKNMQLCKELMNATSKEVYERKLKELLSSLPSTDSKEFMKDWDLCKELWAQFEISLHHGLQHQKSAVEMDYINFLKTFVRSSMNLSQLIKALLKLSRNEDAEPGEIVNETIAFDVDPSCDQYRLLCFPEAARAVICQLSIALSSFYEFKERTDMIFVKKTDTEDEFLLDVSGSKCTCRYFLDTNLPCQHIFAWLQFSKKPLYNELLIPTKWQVFGKSITLDALAESLAQGHVPSSRQHDERLKELQTVLKDTLASCCSHSYEQMGKDIVLLKQIYNLMRTNLSQISKLVVAEEENDQCETMRDISPSLLPTPRKRGRPSKKNKLQLELNLQSKPGKTPSSVQKTQMQPASMKHNLRTNIKHKFVTRGRHTICEESSSPPNCIDEQVTNSEDTKSVTDILSEGQTELVRIVSPETDSTDASLGQLASVGPEDKATMNASIASNSPAVDKATMNGSITSNSPAEDKVTMNASVTSNSPAEDKATMNASLASNSLAEGKHNKTVKKSSNVTNLTNVTTPKCVLDWKRHVDTYQSAGRHSSRSYAGIKRPHCESQSDRTARMEMNEDSDEEEKKNAGSEDDVTEEEDSEEETDVDLLKTKGASTLKDLEAFLSGLPHKTISDILHTTSVLESQEERRQSTKDVSLTNDTSAGDIVIRTCQSNIECINLITEHIKKSCPSYDKYAYQVAASIICQAFLKHVPISDMLESVNPWPGHLPALPERSLQTEITLAAAQTLTVCGHKLNKLDMDTLKPDREISPKVLHAYLELLAQKHSSKMFVIPFDVILEWRDGRFSQSIFRKVHFKTFELLVLPIHCGAEFSDTERKSGDIVVPSWMALVADVKKKTVSMMNPRNEDKYLIAANGYMLQWRRYMQIRSVHTGEMLSSWTTSQIECTSLERDMNSGIMLLMNVEALISDVPPVVMTETHISKYLLYVAIALRDMDRETTVLCVGGPECQQLAARDADWLQCENCRTWWHQACARYSDRGQPFYCSPCQQRIALVGGKRILMEYDDAEDDYEEEMPSKDGQKEVDKQTDDDNEVAQNG